VLHRLPGLADGGAFGFVDLTVVVLVETLEHFGMVRPAGGLGSGGCGGGFGRAGCRGG
jgi:hypothetical protein